MDFVLHFNVSCPYCCYYVLLCAAYWWVISCILWQIIYIYIKYATTRFDGLRKWFPSIVLVFRHDIFTVCTTTGRPCPYIQYIGIYWFLCLYKPYSRVHGKMIESGNHVEKLIQFSDNKVVLLVIVRTNFKELAKITPSATIDVNFPLYLCSKLFAEGDVKRQSWYDARSGVDYFVYHKDTTFSTGLNGMGIYMILCYLTWYDMKWYDMT